MMFCYRRHPELKELDGVCRSKTASDAPEQSSPSQLTAGQNPAEPTEPVAATLLSGDPLAS